MKYTSTVLILLSSISAANAFSPPVVSGPKDYGKDSSVDAAMAQYEAALKMATSTSSTTTKTENPEPLYSDVWLLQQMDQQQDAMEKYEAALRAAVQSTSNNAAQIQQELPKEDMMQQESKLNEGHCRGWDTLTQEIHDIINDKEAETGKKLSEEAKDEIIATVIAGSVLGTAVGSPLLVGAVLGYAGTQILKKENGEKTLEFFGNAKKQIMSKAAAQAKAALEFTQEQWKGDQDLSSVTKKILKAMEENAHAVQRDVQEAPTKFVEHAKQTVESEDFQQLPHRTFNAVRDFLGSKEVKAVSKNAVQAIRDGLESDEMKALQNRASKIFQDTIRPEKK